MGAILVLLFGFLELKGIELTPIFSNITAELVLKLSLFLFYILWFFGPIIDLNNQELILNDAPNNGKLTKEALLLILLIGITFGVLCWVNSFQKFTIVLSCFWLINFGSWFYLVKRILKNPIQSSRSHYLETNDFENYEQLELVEHFISGKWQVLRFSVGVFLLIVLNLLSYTRLSDYIAVSLNLISKDIILAYSALFFVLFTEIWMWYKRIDLIIAMKTVRTVSNKYTILIKNR